MKKHIIIVGTVFLLGTVAYGAMVVGYFLGGANYTARFAPADAAQTVAVLGRLRKGEIDSATLFSFIPMIRTRYPRARASVQMMPKTTRRPCHRGCLFLKIEG